MTWSNIVEMLSHVTENPTFALIIIIIVLIFLSRISDGIGTACRDMPKYLSVVIVATYNFILVIMRREQINYPLNHDPPHNTGDAKNDSEEKSFKDKMISLIKKIKG